MTTIPPTPVPGPATPRRLFIAVVRGENLKPVMGSVDAFVRLVVRDPSGGSKPRVLETKRGRYTSHDHVVTWEHIFSVDLTGMRFVTDRENRPVTLVEVHCLDRVAFMEVAMGSSGSLTTTTLLAQPHQVIEHTCRLRTSSSSSTCTSSSSSHHTTTITNGTTSTTIPSSYYNPTTTTTSPYSSKNDVTIKLLSVCVTDESERVVSEVRMRRALTYQRRSLGCKDHTIDLGEVLLRKLAKRSSSSIPAVTVKLELGQVRATLALANYNSITTTTTARRGGRNRGGSTTSSTTTTTSHHHPYHHHRGSSGMSETRGISSIPEEEEEDMVEEEKEVEVTKAVLVDVVACNVIGKVCVTNGGRVNEEEVVTVVDVDLGSENLMVFDHQNGSSYQRLATPHQRCCQCSTTTTSTTTTTTTPFPPVDRHNSSNTIAPIPILQLCEGSLGVTLRLKSPDSYRYNPLDYHPPHILSWGAKLQQGAYSLHLRPRGVSRSYRDEKVRRERGRRGERRDVEGIGLRGYYLLLPTTTTTTTIVVPVRSPFLACDHQPSSSYLSSSSGWEPPPPFLIFLFPGVVAFE